MSRENDFTEKQLLHQQQMRENRESIKLRKERTHRLIVRGAIAEAAIEGAADMSDDEFQKALYEAIHK